MPLVCPDVMADANGALSGHDGIQAEMMDERCILVDSDDSVLGSESKLTCHYRAVSYTHLTLPTMLWV